MTDSAYVLPALDRQPPAAAPGRRASSRRSRGFAINGRFLAQSVTGVQRYAREITRSLDVILASQDATVDLFVPSRTRDLPVFHAVTARRSHLGTGHGWEQMVLPAICRRPLLNLCNTAPAVSRGHVVCLHDANVFTQPASYSAAFRRSYRLLQPWIARRALRVTTVSNDAAEQIVRHLGVARSAITVLPNGHEHALLWEPAKSRLFLQRPPERPYVLLLGSRAKHKNAARIIGLADALDALGLDIFVVGSEASIFAPAALEQARNIRWLGAVSDNDLALLLSQALCLALPSLTEGFGLPVVEAMAWNCPVVSSDRASLPEVCGTAALLADPTDNRLWLKHIAALAGSPSLRDDLRGRGRTQVEKFSWTASARGYLDLFDRAEADA